MSINDADLAEFLNQPSLVERAKAAAAAKKRFEEREAEEERYQLIEDTKMFLMGELGVPGPDVEATIFDTEPVSNHTKVTMKARFKVGGLEFYSQHLHESVMKMTSYQFGDTTEVRETRLQVYVRTKRGWSTFKDLAGLGEILLG